MSPDPLGRAMLDLQRDRLHGPCLHRDGNDVTDAHVYEFYFRPPEEWSEAEHDLLERVEGPVLDLGCGAGRHALWFQERFETVAVDVSPNAVRCARERGVDDARVMDMFDLEFDEAPSNGRGDESDEAPSNGRGDESDEAPSNGRGDEPGGRFRTVWLYGTQAGLAGSLQRLTTFLDDIAQVTTGDGRLVLDNYDPELDVSGLVGHRPDPREGLAHRVFHVEYDDEVGRTLLFLLFGPDRLREAAAPTSWELREVTRSPDSAHYAAILEKERPK